MNEEKLNMIKHWIEGLSNALGANDFDAAEEIRLAIKKQIEAGAHEFWPVVAHINIASRLAAGASSALAMAKRELEWLEYIGDKRHSDFKMPLIDAALLTWAKNISDGYAYIEDFLHGLSVLSDEIRRDAEAGADRLWPVVAELECFHELLTHAWYGLGVAKGNLEGLVQHQEEQKKHLSNN
jgi:hypothetical protein